VDSKKGNFKIQQTKIFYDSESNQSSILSEEEWTALGFSPNSNKSSVPTLSGVSSKASRDKQITFDRIQYVAYEVIYSSFLLNSINEGMGNENNIASSFAVSQEESEVERTKIILEKVVGKLKELGAKEQVLMFVTGPAGAGKIQQLMLLSNFILNVANQWILSGVIKLSSLQQSLGVCSIIWRCHFT
jgi:hypothetical protein